MDSLVIGDALLAVSSLAGGWLALRATLHGRENGAKLDKVLDQTNGEMERKIRVAVEDVAREHPRLLGQALVDEQLRDLLDAILRAALEE